MTDQHAIEAKELAALREETAALREEVAVLRAVQAAEFNGDPREIGVTAADEVLDAELARVSAHLLLCSGSSAARPRERVLYRKLSDSIGSLLHWRARELSELARTLDLPSYEDLAASLLREEMGSEKPEEPT